MKRQLTFAVFALLMTTFFAGSASAQFGGLLNQVNEKIGKVKQEVEAVKKTKKDIERMTGANKNTKNQPAQNQNNDQPDSWITFTKAHTRVSEAHTWSMNTVGCGDPIFATINYREPVDNSGGYTVSMLVDGEVVLKERMSGGSATSVNETIHIEVIPAPDAVEGYPKVTLSKAKSILDKLPQGDHTLQISVSLNDDPNNVAVGEIQYTGGAGCDAKQPRKPKAQKDTTRIEPPTESQQPAMVEIELQGACGESTRVVYIDNGPYDERTALVKNGNTREKAAVGAKIFLKADFGTDRTLIYTVGSDSFQIVKVCQ